MRQYVPKGAIPIMCRRMRSKFVAKQCRVLQSQTKEASWSSSMTRINTEGFSCALVCFTSPIWAGYCFYFTC